MLLLGRHLGPETELEKTKSSSEGEQVSEVFVSFVSIMEVNIPAKDKIVSV